VCKNQINQTPSLKVLLQQQMSHSNHLKELVVELDYMQVQDTQKTLKSNIPLFLELCGVKGVLFPTTCLGFSHFLLKYLEKFHSVFGGHHISMYNS
jgi:hypothetical protein